MADKEAILAGLAEIVNEETGLETEEVQLEKSFTDDLDIDSISMMTIVVNAEEKFDVKIPDEEVKNLKTVNDAVEFIAQTNPGQLAQPLRKIASGGELSRIMLALMCVAAAGPGGAQTLVFDEVDAGIGGQTARAVGEQLRALAAGRQVLCITHLPQIAVFADQHFKVEKVC